jgi:rhodanese-related sulfurtransferase
VFIDEISCQEKQELISDGAQLIDVRTPIEYHSGALGEAINIPLQSLRHQAEKLDQNQPILVYCRTGRRSGMAKMILLEMGFTKVLDIGGVMRYAGCA